MGSKKKGEKRKAISAEAQELKKNCKDNGAQARAGYVYVFRKGKSTGLLYRHVVAGDHP